jgi:hypothetical protein
MVQIIRFTGASPAKALQERRYEAVLVRPLSSVFRLPSSVIWSSVIRHLSSVIRHLSSVFCHLSSAICPPFSVIDLVVRMEYSELAVELALNDIVMKPVLDG